MKAYPPEQGLWRSASNTTALLRRFLPGKSRPPNTEHRRISLPALMSWFLP